MKIVVVGSYDRSLVVFRGRLLQSMVEMGHEVLACAPFLSVKVRNDLRQIGVDSCLIRMSRTGINPFADLLTLFDLVGLFRKEKPDRVLAYTIKPVLYCGLAARLQGVEQFYPMITGLGYAFSGGDSLHQRLVSTVVKGLYRVALKKCGGIFFQNPDDLAEFSQRGLLGDGLDATLINGSGVDLRHFSVKPLPKEPIFLLIARLIVDKGVREYVEAARILRHCFPGARFLIAGWLDENPSSIKQEELQAWIDDGVIDYLGALDDVRPAIVRCSVYVLPSYREGTPRTVLEAMSMGRAVVTTDAPGCRETVEHGKNGYLVPVRDSNALVEAMGQLIETPGLKERMGDASRQLAERKYDVHKVNKIIMETMGLC